MSVFHRERIIYFQVINAVNCNPIFFSPLKTVSLENFQMAPINLAKQSFQIISQKYVHWTYWSDTTKTWLEGTSESQVV